MNIPIRRIRSKVKESYGNMKIALWLLFIKRKGISYMAGNDKRKDKDRKVLRTGEGQRKDGYYIYRWTSRNGKRHCLTAKTLTDLREKEDAITKDKSDGIRVDAQNVTVNDIFNLWCSMKRGLKDNTFQNYKYMY